MISARIRFHAALMETRSLLVGLIGVGSRLSISPGAMTMKKFSLIVGLSLLMLAACVSSPSDHGSAVLMHQIAPTGKLRAAIPVGPSGNQFRATIDPGTNHPRGVSVDTLRMPLARSLEFPSNS